MTDIAELVQRLRSELDKRGWLLSETLFNDIVAAVEAVGTKRIAELEEELAICLRERRELLEDLHGSD